MKETIHNTKYYTLDIDQSKNRLLIKPIGFWRNKGVVPKYLNQIFEAIDKKLRKDFMVILDISDMLTHPREVQDEIHTNAVIGVMERNPKAAIIVMPKDDISVMQANFLMRKHGIETKPFNSLEEAETFLDEYIIRHNLK